VLEVVMFDLGETLLTGTPSALFPGVVPALQAIQALQTTANQSLELCLVSNFKMPPPAAPAKPAQIQALFDEYLAILSGWASGRSSSRSSDTSLCPRIAAFPSPTVAFFNWLCFAWA